jgi:hypothetical protein
MRRILAGIVSAVVGATVCGLVTTYLGSDEAPVLATVAATVGTYAALDELGLIPPPFDSQVESIRYRDGTSDDNGRK